MGWSLWFKKGELYCTETLWLNYLPNYLYSIKKQRVNGHSIGYVPFAICCYDAHTGQASFVQRVTKDLGRTTHSRVICCTVYKPTAHSGVKLDWEVIRPDILNVMESLNVIFCWVFLWALWVSFIVMSLFGDSNKTKIWVTDFPLYSKQHLLLQ